MTDASQAAKALAKRSWEVTPDRTARTAKAREAGPGSLTYWRRQLVDSDPTLEGAPNLDQMAAAMKAAFYRSLGKKGQRARKAGA